MARYFPVSLKSCLRRPLPGLGLLMCLSMPGVAAPVSFNREILPILSDKCFHCHGPDAAHREAELRLDHREDAIKDDAFVPGKSAESEAISRIFSTDPDEVMPPPKSHLTLTQ